jgi:hypothetical protein
MRLCHHPSLVRLAAAAKAGVTIRLTLALFARVILSENRFPLFGITR